MLRHMASGLYSFTETARNWERRFLTHFKFDQTDVESLGEVTRRIVASGAILYPDDMPVKTLAILNELVNTAHGVFLTSGGKRVLEMEQPEKLLLAVRLALLTAVSNTYHLCVVAAENQELRRLLDGG